ncbi:MAG: hypothetical protein JSW11_07050, partial [Candidatus Heimdallarchaeota archaeon]
MEFNLPFDKLIRKFSDQGDVVSLEDFQERLDILISKIQKEYETSKEAEQTYQEEYNEKLSKLDFKGSKKAVEESRHQLARSLELDVLLEFLLNIKKMSVKILPQTFQQSKQLEKFSQIAAQIFDQKKLRSQYGRRMILKQFKKFVPPSAADSTLDEITGEKEGDTDIERILQEVKDGIVDDNSIDSEIEKIIEEVRSKKGSTE